MQIILLTVILAICFLIPINGASQDERSAPIGIETSASYDYLQDVKLHFLISYTIRQHMPFAGLEFPVSLDPIANFGVTAGYKFFPNRNRQKFDFFFLYLIEADSRKLYSKSTENGFSLQNLIGYGLNIYFNDQIYLVHHLAAGIENAWFRGHESFSDLSLSFNLGFGIKLKSIKKRQ
ncbi:MAG: hypothetical protein KQI35_01665 [Bacteroidetes bacterium]|nr:hypothetical protein [Bacteroidota bacterium]